MLDSATSSLLLEGMHCAVILMDSQLRLRYMNTAAETLFQISANRHEGEHISGLFSENGDIPEGLIKALQNQQRFTKRQTVFRLPLPGEIVVDYTVTPLLDKRNSLLMEIQPIDRALKISQDEMLLSSQEVARKLVRGLAHEIKNPLGGLRGAAQLLEREFPNEQLKDYTNIIINEADRLRKLVDQMLGPHQKLHIVPVNIHEVLEHIRKLLSAETQFALQVITDYDPSLPNVAGDREQLVQACLNVARNAMQALEDTDEPVLIFKTRIQRQVTIGNTSHRLMLRIDIIDNGPGIPADIAENLFFPMVSGRQGGTGLGLSIAQTIINQHNGLIKFESMPGETVFSLYLPLEKRHV